MKLPALSDVSFAVEKGEFVVLSGASGAGKTTLLRLLYADEQASDGEIEVAGFNVTGLKRSEVPLLRRSLGIVFQDAKLLSGRTVFENIAFVLRVLGTPRREITPKAFQALKAVGLSSRAQAYPAQLSQGEAQRAALARAIVKSPALLLAERGHGGRDPRADQGHLEPRHHRALRHSSIAPGDPAQAPHPAPRSRRPDQGRRMSKVMEAGAQR